MHLKQKVKKKKKMAVILILLNEKLCGWGYTYAETKAE